MHRLLPSSLRVPIEVNVWSYFLLISDSFFFSWLSSFHILFAVFTLFLSHSLSLCSLHKPPLFYQLKTWNQHFHWFLQHVPQLWSSCLIYGDLSPLLFWHFSPTLPDMPHGWKMIARVELLLMFCHSTACTAKHSNPNQHIGLLFKVAVSTPYVKVLKDLISKILLSTFVW